jgi:uncharacterized protein (TIGR02646 family)
MKHVRRLREEPAALAEFRARSADGDGSTGGPGATWEAFRRDAVYAEVLAALTAAQHGLCVYCEQRLTRGGTLIPGDYQIEHVLPKSKGQERVLDWKNLALACGGGTGATWDDDTRFLPDRTGEAQERRAKNKPRARSPGANESCGQSKEDKDLPAGCDPRTLPLVPAVVRVGSDGTISVDQAGCAQSGISASDLDDMINKRLRLNCERLRLARQKVADNIRSWWVAIAQELLNTGRFDPAQQRQLVELMNAGRLQPDEHGHLCAFWTTERCFLPDADRWLTAHAGLFT